VLQTPQYSLKVARHNLDSHSEVIKACLACNKDGISVSQSRLIFQDLSRWQSDTISVSVEHDTCSLASGAFNRLNPLTCPHRCPQALQESKTASSSIAAVVTAHDRLDRFGRLICVVEWDSANVVVEDMGLDDTVQKLAADETKFAVDGCGCTSSVVPAGRGVVRKARIGVLEVGDSHYATVSMPNPLAIHANHLPSQ